jgi:hypothetical protein
MPIDRMPVKVDVVEYGVVGIGHVNEYATLKKALFCILHPVSLEKYF